MRFPQRSELTGGRDFASEIKSYQGSFPSTPEHPNTRWVADEALVIILFGNNDMVRVTLPIIIHTVLIVTYHRKKQIAVCDLMFYGNLVH